MSRQKPVPPGAQRVNPTSKIIVQIFDPGKDPKKDPPRQTVSYPPPRGGPKIDVKP